jgi:hypothetical protein
MVGALATCRGGCAQALSQVPECAEVIAHGAAALCGGGRWVVLDLKVPDNTPGWLARPGTAMVRPFASIDAWIMRRPWETIRAAMQEELADLSWADLFFGTAFLAAGSRGPGTFGVRPPGERSSVTVVAVVKGSLAPNHGPKRTAPPRRDRP